MHPEQPLLHDWFAEAFARYLTIRPAGLQMPHGALVNPLRVRLRTCRPARTLYEKQQPRCRSLDGLQSITEARACASCLHRKTCTPQIYLEVLHDGVPYRLLLAYSSARNFMFFVSRLRQHGQPVENAEVILAVSDRGRWGELRFSMPPPPPPA